MKRKKAERMGMGLSICRSLSKLMAVNSGPKIIPIKVHRARMMQKMQAESLADLVRLADKAEV